MLEVSSLSHMFASKIEQQSHQVETLFTDAEARRAHANAPRSSPALRTPLRLAVSSLPKTGPSPHTHHARAAGV